MTSEAHNIYSTTLLDELRFRVPLDQVVAHHVTLKRSGSALRGPCPIHGSGKGSSTSFSVRNGRYRCFSCGERGDAIAFTMWAERVGFGEAVRRLARDAGINLPQLRHHQDDPAEVARLDRERADRLAAYRRERDAKDASERAATIAKARVIWGASIPIAGTLAERYLIDTRGIPVPDAGWPECLRWHAAGRALVAAGTDTGGAVQFVHCIVVRADAQNALRNDGSKRKVSRGPMNSAAIRIPGDGEAVLHAEGLETGLSAWIATGAPAVIYAGAIADRFQPQSGLNIVLRDDDAIGSPADIALAKAIERWREVGIDFAIASPWPERRGDRSDFNDVLRAHGAGAARERILSDPPPWPEKPLFPDLRPCDPPRPLPTATLADVSAHHAGTMLRFYRQSTPDDAPQVHIGGQGGTGKTEAAVRFTREEPDRIAVLVPEHEVLGAELVQRYRRAGHDFVPLIGRGDPFNPEPGDLCIEPEHVAEARKADQDIAKTCCGTADGPHCRSFMVCPFQAGLARAAAAGKGFVGAQNHLFHPLPKAVAADIGRLVIEEDFVQHGVRIFHVTHDSFSAAAIEQWPALRNGERDDHQTQKFRWFGAALLKAGEVDGELTAENMRAVGIRKEDFAEAIRICRRRKREVAMYPGMSIEARREAAAAGAINGQIGNLVTLIASAQEGFDGTAPGRITIVTSRGKRGAVRQFTVHTLRTVADWARDKPVLVNTATPQVEVLRQFFPRLEVRTPPEVATPFAENRLIVGGFAKTTVERSARKRREMNRFLKLEALGELETSFVGFKGTKEEITKGVPGIIAQHHGQNAGGDRCRDVGVHTVQDGFRPKTRDIAALVRAKTGRIPSMEPPEEAIGRVLMNEGTGREGWSVLRYADPAMQAEYAHHHAGSISQGVARSRAVRRTAINPVRNNVLGRVAPQDMVFSSVQLWRDVQSGKLGEMAIRRRVYLNAATMTTMHSDLFVSEKAASNARATFGDAWTRLRGWVERDRRPWDRMRFKLSGQGHGWQWAVYPAADEAAVFCEIETKFGKITEWENERFTEGRPQHPQPVPEAMAEEVPGTVHEVEAEPGMSSSSPPPPLWWPGSGAEPVERPERPPDG